MRALVILHPGFEEIEAVSPIDLLSRASVEVVSASTTDGRAVLGRSGITLMADTLLADAALEAFDAVILPGGPGIGDLRKNRLLCDLLQRQHAAGQWLACICAAPLLLLDAGLLDGGTRYTCHPSVEEELPGRAEAAAVALDGTILTSRGAGTAVEFSLALIEKLRDRKTAEAVAESICLGGSRTANLQEE